MKKQIGIRTFLGVILTWFSAACDFANQEIKEPIPIPESFSISGENQLQENWWRVFNDTKLNTLMDQALNQNLDLLTAWDRLDQASASARRAGAERWPTLNAEVEGSYSYTNNGDNANFFLGMAAGYEVDLWGRIRSATRAAHFDLLATEENLRAVALSISAEVAATWYRIAEQRGQLELLRQQDITNRQMLDLLNVRFRSGQAYAADVLQQQQLIETNVGSRVRIESQIELLKHQLTVLLGRAPQSQELNSEPKLIELPPLPETGLPLDLVRRRPDVQSAYRRVQAADQRVATAIAERFPRISLSASASTSDSDVRDLFSNWLLNLGANLLVPLIDGNRRKADVEIAEASASEALHDYGRVVLEALREVEDALTLERSKLKLKDSLEKQLALSTRVTERIRDNYTKGAEIFMRVLDSILKHQALQRSFITVEHELIDNRITLCRALAGGWQLARPQTSSTSSTGGDR